MATSLTLQNDASLAQGYVKVNGTTSATFTTSGITGNLVGNADTATKLSTATGSAPSYACRAWVNFDGTRDTSGAVSAANTNRLIRASGNVASVLRNGAGDYTVTFTTAMSDANYAVFCNGGIAPLTADNATAYIGLSRRSYPAITTSTARIACNLINGVGVFTMNADADYINVSIFS